MLFEYGLIKTTDCRHDKMSKMLLLCKHEDLHKMVWRMVPLSCEPALEWKKQELLELTCEPSILVSPRPQWEIPSKPMCIASEKELSRLTSVLFKFMHMYAWVSAHTLCTHIHIHTRNQINKILYSPEAGSVFLPLYISIDLWWIAQ